MDTNKHAFSQRTNRLTILLIVIVYLFLGYFVYREWETLKNYQWQLDWAKLIISLLLHLITMFLLFGGWLVIITQLMGVRNWRADFRIYSLSTFARRIPLPIWYLGSRFYLYKREQGSGILALTASSIEIYLLALSGIMSYNILMPWYTYTQEWPWEIFLVINGVLILVLAINPNVIINLINYILRKIKRPIILSSISRRNLIICLVLYIIAWFIDGFSAYFALAALIPTPMSPVNIVGIFTIVNLISMIFLVLPAGFGFKEITLAALLHSWIPLSAALIFSFLYRFLQILSETLWVLLSQLLSKPLE